MDEDILELVAQNDQAFQTDASQDLGSLEDDNERPATADGDSTEVLIFLTFDSHLLAFNRKLLQCES
jgi:hypothetical protein